MFTFNVKLEGIKNIDAVTNCSYFKVGNDRSEKNSYRIAEDSERVENRIVFDNQVNVTTSIDARVKRELFVS